MNTNGHEFTKTRRPARSNDARGITQCLFKLLAAGLVISEFTGCRYGADTTAQNLKYGFIGQHYVLQKEGCLVKAPYYRFPVLLPSREADQSNLIAKIPAGTAIRIEGSEMWHSHPMTHEMTWGQIESGTYAGKYVGTNPIGLSARAVSPEYAKPLIDPITAPTP